MIIAADHASILYYAKRYNRALAQARAVLNMDPSAPRAATIVMFSFVQQQEFAEALEFIEHHETAVNDPWLSVKEAVVYGYWGRFRGAKSVDQGGAVCVETGTEDSGATRGLFGGGSKRPDHRPPARGGG